MILLCDHFWPLDDSKSHCLVTDYKSVAASEAVSPYQSPSIKYRFSNFVRLAEASFCLD